MRLYPGLHVGLRWLAVIGLIGVMSGCSQSSRLPAAPSINPPAPPPVSPAPSSPAPVVTSVLPAAGSAAGGTTLTILGTGFMPGMIAMFDGIRVTVRFESRAASGTMFYVETPVHAAGAVDLVVSNPDGQSHRVEAGYRYVPAESFDPNGTWGGYSLNGTDTWVEFVIRDKELVSAWCEYATRVDLTFAESPSVENGAFSVTAAGGATISGRMLSASEWEGTISVPSCTTTPLPWRADRQATSRSR